MRHLPCFCVMVLAFWCSVAAAQTGEVVDAVGPRLLCEEPTHDFGSVTNKDWFKKSFVLRNVGDSPLNLGKIQTCCGSRTSVDDKVVEPGSFVPDPLPAVAPTSGPYDFLFDRGAFIADGSRPNPTIKAA